MLYIFLSVLQGYPSVGAGFTSPSRVPSPCPGNWVGDLSNVSWSPHRSLRVLETFGQKIRNFVWFGDPVPRFWGPRPLILGTPRKLHSLKIYKIYIFFHPSEQGRGGGVFPYPLNTQRACPSLATLIWHLTSLGESQLHLKKEIYLCV